MLNSKKTIKDLLKKIDIEINGDRDWDIQIHNEGFYSRVLREGSIGLGEAYMEKWWDCNRLDLFFEKILRSETKEFSNFKLFLLKLKATIFNMQTPKRSQNVADKHYDLGNDLYMSFLDPYNQYTCGYFENTDDLDEAQEKKLDLICKKLDLKKDDKVVDIGCGWGGLAKFASENYGCHVTGISISKEQIKYAKEITKDLPVKMQCGDYREIEGRFDKVVSIGIMEHIGYKNYESFIEKMKSLMKDDSLFLLHTIGRNNSVKTTNPWIDKYIFPGGMIPSLKQVCNAIENKLILEDLHNFGRYYAKTLIAWDKNFRENFSSLPEKYDERFYRMWRYYLLSCAEAFKTRNLQLWQFVFTKKEFEEMYSPVR